MAHRATARRLQDVPLRTKITAVTVFILTLGILVVGAGTLLLLRPQLISQVDNDLQALRYDQSRALAPGADAEHGVTRQDILDAPHDHYVAFVPAATGVVAYDNWSDQGTAPELPQLDMSWTLNPDYDQVISLNQNDGKGEWRAILLPLTAADNSSEYIGTLVIATSMSTITDILARNLAIYIGFGIAVVVLGALLTRVLVTTTFEPLREVEVTAGRIADGDFSQRLPVSSANTEVGSLNRSLNTMLSRIDAAFADRARTIEQMRRFVGDASHELRTPLVSLRGYAELYRMGALRSEEEVGQAMERIEKEAIRMSALVEDLLELARLDETKPLSITPVDLVPLARDAALDAMAGSPDRVVAVDVSALEAERETAAPEPLPEPEPSTAPLPTAPGATGPIAIAGATLAFLRGRRGRRPASEPPAQTTTPSSAVSAALASSGETEPAELYVFAEENKIRQVLTNLVGNAVRFTAPGEPIEIVLSHDPTRTRARIDVIDHGEGIPPQIREKIFQRFWRADTSRARETGGSGLGLAIVYSIVRAHGGTVSVDDTPGGGATFRVELPLLPTVVQAAPTPQL